MIIARLFGGLGNQLFQYACARALAWEREVPLALDTRLTQTADHGAYALDHFAIEAEIARAAQLPPGKDAPLRNALWRRFGRSPRYVRERGLGYDPDQFPPGSDLYLHGYFQSERYFADHAARLRDSLRVVTPPCAENQRWLDEIAATHSVSLHVRRGDYVSAAGATHGTCDAAYYARALEHVIEASGQTPVVFVFSDDPDWARANLAFAAETRFAGHNGPDKHYEDLRLMAACRHNIIANSTFSWWAGWLNPDPTKIVVAPKHWYQPGTLHNPDILPRSWTAL